MGQYWIPVNLDKKSSSTHKLNPAKLWEIVANDHVGQSVVHSVRCNARTMRRR